MIKKMQFSKYSLERYSDTETLRNCPGLNYKWIFFFKGTNNQIQESKETVFPCDTHMSVVNSFPKFTFGCLVVLFYH